MDEKKRLYIIYIYIAYIYRERERKKAFLAVCSLDFHGSNWVQISFPCLPVICSILIRSNPIKISDNRDLERREKETEKDR